MATILINDKVDENLKFKLKDRHDVIEAHYPVNELIDKIKDVDVIIVKSKTRITKEILDAAKSTNRLRLIIRAGVGLDNIDVDYAQSKNIKVKNTPNSSTNAVAELALSYMLLMSRNVMKANNEMHMGVWNKENHIGNELSGKTLGIIGLGRIGLHLAKLASAFNMKIVYYDPYSKNDLYEFLNLDELLSSSDFISLHLPSIGDSIIKKEHLNIIKNGMNLINLARGDLIEEDFIIDGIQSKIISNIALDVFLSEPYIRKEFLNYENIFLTPHIGAQTYEAQEKISLEILDIINSEFNHV